MLLTGDLEGEGERQVLGILNGTSSLLSPKDKDTDEIINEPIEVTKDYDVLNKRVTRLIQFRFPCSSL